MKAFLNTSFWILFFCGVGVIQILIAFFYTWLQGGNTSNVHDFYLDGFFLFFSISLVSAIFYEFTFENDCKISKPVKNFLLFFCVIIAGLAMMVYAMAYATKLNLHKNNLGNYILAQKVLTTFSILVSFIMKGIVNYSK